MAEGDDGATRLSDLLGLRFENPVILREALTHASSGASDAVPNYERLEFLGDRVLGLIVADLLFKRFPADREGELAKRHASLVSRQALVHVATELTLGEFLNMPAGEAAAGTHKRPTILADACEALIGALYVDGGLEPARDFIERFWGPMVEDTPPVDPKTQLQEWVQGRSRKLPQYMTVGEQGPAHKPVFTVEVRIDGQEPVTGSGSSKRMAEQEAARQMLAQLGMVSVETGASDDG